MIVKVPCLRVPKTFAEKAIRTASNLGIFDRKLKIRREDDTILIPLTRRPSESELMSMFKGAQLLEEKFEAVKARPRTLIEALEDKLSPHLLSMLPTSFDIIGDIAVVEIPPELERYGTMVGEAILAMHKNVCTVLAKSSAISGPYRIREFRVVAGEDKRETLHREHGLAYRLDVSRIYFSPRLSFERERVANQVKDGEVILDMFAGAGPFSILIAKKHLVKVYAVDLNPVAVQYLRENIRLNGVQERVVALEGDVRAVMGEAFTNFFDRVIMDFPVESIKYIDVACRVLKKGGIIHYYQFAAEPDPIEKAKEAFSEAVARSQRKVKEILSARLVRATAPHEWQVAIDARLS